MIEMIHNIQPVTPPRARSPEPATHDISRASSDRIPDLKEFFASVERATVAALPGSDKARYQDVRVLLLSWAEDDSGVLGGLDRLAEVFKDLYGFSVEKWLIPSEKSHNTLNRKILDFTEIGLTEDVLLIVYYGGYGTLDEYRRSVWRW